MNYIKREQCVITGAKDLELLYNLLDFPVFIGCTEKDQETDLFADMEWAISKSSGVIQLAKLLPLDIVYSGYHSEAVGGVWQRHHEDFSDFVIKHTAVNSVVEMGGSNGALAERCLGKSINIKSWTIVEPNPDPNYEPTNNKIKVKKSFIEEQVGLLSHKSVFIHSHVLEHLYDPLKTMQCIANRQNIGNKMIFSIPDLYQYLNRKYVNAINFEHTYFITEKIADSFLNRLGYEVQEKQYFENHSIFYSAKYTGKNRADSFLNYYQEYKKMYLDMIEYYKKEVVRLNDKIENFKGEVYLFGGHIFSQFLIYMGLKEKNIKGIIDNSKEKERKRLYGTSLTVFNLSIVKDQEGVMVIVKAGQYQEEVEKQLTELNDTLILLR